MRKILFIILSIIYFNVPLAEAAAMILSGDDWTFGQYRLGRRYPAKVPGVVHTDLMANGIIEDPFFGLNERSVQWIDKEDWVYEKVFSVDSALMSEDIIELVFDGLDTYADVFLNDSLVLQADNMFRVWKTDVKSQLRSGLNNLKVILRSPIATDMPKWEDMPDQYRASNDQSENGGVFDRKLSVFARKAGYHYGWDWGPRLVTSGIWRDVRLEGWSDACIRDIHLRRNEVSAQRAHVNNIVEIEADNYVEDVIIKVTDKESGKVMGAKKCELRQGSNVIPIEFTIKNPRLWWCHNLGKPELYTFNTTVELPSGKKLVKSERIGLRKVEIVTEPDAEGTMQFYFVLNDVPVFAKGTNYIPQDNFLPRVTPQRHRRTLEDAVAANMNMVRIWGGGIYEDDVFYDICDELGLMVWQDFMFACSTYPASGYWLENVKMEAKDNLRRLRNHPSIVLWCGGNECLDALYNWGWKRQHEQKDPAQARRIESEIDSLYLNALPEMVTIHNPDAFYWPNSPYSGPGKGSDGINGDRHYYGVWMRKHPVSMYNNEKSHFFSEYGVQSFPEYSTILSYAPDTAAHSLDSDVMMWHQRGGESANSNIAWYLENEYHTPEDFMELLYLNQVFQADAMRTAIEAHRRDMPHCMGSLLWQHDDCWPVASWSTRDYYGKWKAAHYLVRRVFENVIVSAEADTDSIHAYVISDFANDFKGELQISVYKLNGEKIHETSVPVNVKALSSSRLWSERIADTLHGENPEDVVINLTIKADGLFHTGNYYLCKQSELNIPEVKVEYVVTPIDNGYNVTVSADKFARAIYLDIDGEDELFDDNFFDLLPGDSRTCFVKSALNPEEFKSKLKIRSLTHRSPENQLRVGMERESRMRVFEKKLAPIF